MEVVIAEFYHLDQGVSVRLRDEPAGPAGQGAQHVGSGEELLQGVNRDAVTLVQGQRLELLERVHVEKLQPDFVVECINKLETGVFEMICTVKYLVNSLGINMSTSSIQNLKVDQFVKNYSRLVKHRHIGPNARETKILEAWAENSDLQDVHTIEFVQLEADQPRTN